MLSQIIEEELKFPSGTATAQLVSVLHGLPPPDTAVRRRRVYSEIATDEGDDITTPDSHLHDGYGEVDHNEREDAEAGGWQALGYSFLASSFMTVSRKLGTVLAPVFHLI